MWVFLIDSSEPKPFAQFQIINNSVTKVAESLQI